MNKVCPQSEKCCELNPDHFDEYKHPHLNDLLQQGDNLYLPDNFPQSRQVVMEQLSVLKTLRIDDISTQKDACKDEPSTSNADSNKITSRAVNSPKHQKYTMADKMKSNYPYNLFFTTIPKLHDTLNQKNSITFSDLLCPSLGELKCSLQLNFLVEIEWLIEQYKVHNVHTKPLTVVYGWDLPDMTDYIQKFLPNVKHHLMKLKNPMGHHHCKIGVYVYTDNSIRIVVSTANLYYEDWNHYNNGLWVSPRCPQLPRNTPCDKGESPTGFKSTLLKYLKTYKLYLIKDFMRYISNADFSSVNVFFVASTPGTHYPNGTKCHFYRTLNLLSSHCKIDSDPDSWEVNVQASSLGSFGKRPIDWLQSVLLRSLACRQNYSPIPDPQVNINIIYPTVDDAVSCYFGEDGAGCLHYQKDLHKKQLWLQTYLRVASLVKSASKKFILYLGSKYVDITQ
ncbi:probable tyrosyl-DNA phosphodiesterase isoform X2 [Onthophagus taurus]|uniref:probable tyrosyl-DNA phosphodiesterase isoform X2 n=1 Tax=Onthophagus taurus TaxID=166361 RepID=UPI0039BE6F28